LKASKNQVSKTGRKTGLIRGIQRRLVCGQHRIRLVAQRPPMLLGRDTRHPFYGRKEPNER
ncbi:MAG: hypothetical protein U0P28_12155, partial [Ruminococcus sp.]